jgi:hypothetical protein
MWCAGSDNEPGWCQLVIKIKGGIFYRRKYHEVGTEVSFPFRRRTRNVVGRGKSWCSAYITLFFSGVGEKNAMMALKFIKVGPRTHRTARIVRAIEKRREGGGRAGFTLARGGRSILRL